MKILFVTGAYPKGMEAELIELGKGTPLSIPSNTFQWAVIDGLEKNRADYQVVSYPFLSCYPLHFKKMYSPKANMIIDGHKIGSMEPFFNVSMLSRWSIKNRLYKYVSRWAAENYKEDKLVVLTYTPSSWFIYPLLKAKKKYPNLVICPIITDLPDDYIHPMYKLSKYKKYVQTKEVNLIKKTYDDTDLFVLLSKPMEEKAPQAVGKDIIIEGISADCYNNIESKEATKGKIVLYTGSLGIHTSINDLVEAFRITTNPDFRLVICGGGECEANIKANAAEDSRIIFKGFLPREEVINLQKEATAVINPRKPSIPITKYSFPSKTMEYMSSGTPLIGYKLPGIPSEYYNHYYAIDNEDNKELARVLNEVLNMPQEELNSKAKDAFDFIVNNKTSLHQIKRLLDFLKK